MSSWVSQDLEQQIVPVDAGAYMGALPALPELSPETAGDARAGQPKVVVIDDDPTGCQTVHDVPMLLEWSLDALSVGFQDHAPAFFILTNSRAVDPAAARQINAGIAQNLKLAAAAFGTEYVVVSRSDSTMRGHYPAETDVLESELGPYDGVIIAPCFFEAGRHTIHGIHWVRQGDMLAPAAQTESAEDPTFGFANSYLPAWVAEKTGGRIAVDQVMRIDIDDLRQGGADAVAGALYEARDGQPIVVDAAEYGDLDIFVAGLKRAEARGKRFLYRTAASFVRARAGISERPLLGYDELVPRPGAPGLVAVGSFVPRTTAQLDALLGANPEAGVELRVRDLLRPFGSEATVLEAVAQVCRLYDRGMTPVIYTSRELVAGDGPLESLRVMNVVSDAMVDVVRRATEARKFGFVVAKGGITSHDLAYKALNARRTRVLGQVAAGVPVWRLGDESAAPGMPYVVFPGNVGEAGTLREVVGRLNGTRKPGAGFPCSRE